MAKSSDTVGMVGSTTFIDPVCFLLCKHDVAYNFLYRDPATLMQLIIHYFAGAHCTLIHSYTVHSYTHTPPFLHLLFPSPPLFPSSSTARELHIAYALSRHFFWWQNILWPEQLQPAVTGHTTVFLSGEDSIVPAHSV
jgi:hypothetical protein